MIHESVDYQSEGCTAFRQLEEVERHPVDGNNFVTYQKLQFHTYNQTRGPNVDKTKAYKKNRVFRVTLVKKIR